MASFVARSGEIEVRLSVEDRRLLSAVPQVLESVTADRDDPAHAVLHRAAYPHDADESERFEAVVEGERAAGRVIDRAVVAAVAGGATSISRMEALSLLRSMNEARLALAARSGVFDEGPGWERRGATDPRVAAALWLAHLQTDLLRAVDRLSG